MNTTFVNDSPRNWHFKKRKAMKQIQPSKN